MNKNLISILIASDDALINLKEQIDYFNDFLFFIFFFVNGNGLIFVKINWFFLMICFYILLFAVCIVCTQESDDLVDYFVI